MKKSVVMLMMVAAFGLALTTTSCRDKKDAGDKIEEAADDVQDAADDAGDAVEDAAEDTGDAIDDATD